MKTFFALGFAAAVAAATLLFGFNQADPTVPRWAAIHAIAICGLLWVACQPRVEIPKAAFLGLALLAWAGLSLLWSSDQKGGLVELANGIALFGVFLLTGLIRRSCKARAAGRCVTHGTILPNA